MSGWGGGCVGDGFGGGGGDDEAGGQASLTPSFALLRTWSIRCSSLEVLSALIWRHKYVFVGTDVGGGLPFDVVGVLLKLFEWEGKSALYVTDGVESLAMLQYWYCSSGGTDASPSGFAFCAVDKLHDVAADRQFDVLVVDRWAGVDAKLAFDGPFTPTNVAINDRMADLVSRAHSVVLVKDLIGGFNPGAFSGELQKFLTNYDQA